MKQAASKGTRLETSDDELNNGKYHNYHKLNQMDDEEREVQQIIDMALLEMNNGNYGKAVSLLDKAKELYGSNRAEELQELIIKLQTNAFKANYNKANNYSNPSSVRHRNHFQSEEKSSAEYKSQNYFTNEQLTLINKINNCENYYQVLSVSFEASESEIKKAYKKLALHLHPDKNHAPGAAEAFKRLGNAVAILTNPKKRKEYDLSCSDYITTSNTRTFNFYESTSSQQEYHGYGHPHHYHNSSHNSCKGNEEFTADELFHMFFGNYPSTQSHCRRRPYQSANQRQPQEHGQQPSLAFGLLLIMILMSMFMSLFSTDPLYSLSHSSKYNVRRQTQHLSIPYYVKQNFDNEYQGSLARLENSVEEDYVYMMKQHCFRERSYREAMMARARSFGSRAQFAQAQGLKMPSCDNLSRVGITRYTLY